MDDIFNNLFNFWSGGALDTASTGDWTTHTYTPQIGDFPFVPQIGDAPYAPVFGNNPSLGTSTTIVMHTHDALPEIKDVIFNPPATVVLWADGTKTVVKCQPRDAYSKETGLAMAICKKAYGNKGAYNDVFNKWLSK